MSDWVWGGRRRKQVKTVWQVPGLDGRMVEQFTVIKDKGQEQVSRSRI